MSMGLTPRQKEAFDFIDGYLAQHGGVSPSYQEISDGIGLNSKSSASRLVAGLVERGVVARIPKRARCFSIVRRAAAACPHCGGSL